MKKYTCFYCGKELQFDEPYKDDSYQTDHLFPKSKYPEFDKSKYKFNFVPSCGACNRKKSSTSPIKWLSYVVWEYDRDEDYFFDYIKRLGYTLSEFLGGKKISVQELQDYITKREIECKRWWRKQHRLDDHGGWHDVYIKQKNDILRFYQNYYLEDSEV